MAENLHFIAKKEQKYKIIHAIEILLAFNDIDVKIEKENNKRFEK